jgi:tetratricopeptide (TPR) repeat protein
MADNPRLDDLRRRVQQDPASIAFAQLGEECRRAGACQEAVDVCRAGLVIHPEYTSARVTLGRALIELGNLADAERELVRVLESAPENLTAIRALALLHRRRGDLAQALAHYQDALQLAPNDPELEHIVERLAQDLEAQRRQPQPQPVPPAPAPESLALHAQTSEVAATVDLGGTLTPTADDDRGARTLAALEQWLAAVHVARARRRS